MSGSGHYGSDHSLLMDHIESPPPIGTGTPWMVEGFRDYFFAVSQRSIGDVSDYNVHLPTDGHLYDTHEIYAGPDGMVYFTQRMHDRVGRFTLDGRVEFFDLPEGSRPHGLRFSRNGGWYVTLENFDEIVELSKKDGSIVAAYSVAFDCPQIQGIVGPHGLAIDQQNRLWYTGRTSDVLGWVDPKTGEHRRFELPTRPKIAPNFDHELVKPKASAPIYIDFDREDNSWFVNLQTNQIGRIDPQNQMSLFEIEGFDTDNTRPINIFQGPDGFMWVTIEGDNSPSAENTQQSLGGIARFDPSTETFEAYPQNLSKGAGGVLGVKDNSVWFQYQEEALVRLMVDDLGRSDQQTFPLPDIGKRVMHRIAQGPDGNMWFTSLHADVVSRLVTDQQGLPVYGFDQTHTGDQYLSALPMEWTHLLQPESGYDSPDPLFLSPSAGDEVIATSRFLDRLTGQTVWTIEGDEYETWLSSARYEWVGEDFRVYDELSDASDLIPVYRALDADDASLLQSTDPGSVDASIHADSSVAWYAFAIPENAAFG